MQPDTHPYRTLLIIMLVAVVYVVSAVALLGYFFPPIPESLPPYKFYN